MCVDEDSKLTLYTGGHPSHDLSRQPREPLAGPNRQFVIFVEVLFVTSMIQEGNPIDFCLFKFITRFACECFRSIFIEPLEQLTHITPCYLLDCGLWLAGPLEVKPLNGAHGD